MWTSGLPFVSGGLASVPRLQTPIPLHCVQLGSKGTHSSLPQTQICVIAAEGKRPLNYSSIRATENFSREDDLGRHLGTASQQSELRMALESDKPTACHGVAGVPNASSLALIPWPTTGGGFRTLGDTCGCHGWGCVAVITGDVWLSRPGCSGIEWGV